MRPFAPLPTLLVACFLAAASTPVPAQDDLSGSRAIRVLAAAVKREGRAAEERFWARVREAGAPLVEPAGRPGFSLVTFLYQGDNETESVRLASNLNALLIDGIVADFDALGKLSQIPGTDVWHIGFEVRNDVRVPYAFEVVMNGGQSAEVLDPNNPEVWEKDVELLRSSILDLPAAPAQPWRERTTEAGSWKEVELGGLEDPRKVWVHLPMTFDPKRDEAYPAFVGLGAFGFSVGMRVDRIVDYLTEKGLLPPIVVALTDVRRGSEAERYQPTVRAVADTLLPYLAAHYSVAEDPMCSRCRGRTTGGRQRRRSSSGWRSARQENGRAEFASSLASGKLETVVTTTNHGHCMVATNRHMRNVLRAKGYELRYVEFNGVHSELNWQDWLADGLIHFFGNRR